jgi:ascorbate-specific PTS system EIIC-type component UlaA
MNEEPNPPPEPENTNPIPIMLWLLVAFLPSVVSIGLMRLKNTPSEMLTGLVILAGACCVSSAFGVLRGVKEVGLRVLLGLFLAGGFFVLNVIIVIFVGCSGMGNI